MADLVGGVIFLVLSAFVFYHSRFLPPSRTAAPGPELWPDLVAIFGALLAGLLIVRALRVLLARPAAAPARAASGQPNLWRGSVLLGLSAAYATGMPTLGFLTSSFVFLTLAMLTLGVRRLYLLLPLAAALAWGVFYLFGVLLRVRLPAGLLI